MVSSWRRLGSLYFFCSSWSFGCSLDISREARTCLDMSGHVIPRMMIVKATMARPKLLNRMLFSTIITLIIGLSRILFQTKSTTVTRLSLLLADYGHGAGCGIDAHESTVLLQY